MKDEKDKLEPIELAKSKGWTTLSEWVADGKNPEDWVDFDRFNAIGVSISEMRSKQRQSKKDKKEEKRKNKIKNELKEEIERITECIDKGLTLNQYMEQRIKYLKSIDNMDK